RRDRRGADRRLSAQASRAAAGPRGRAAAARDDGPPEPRAACGRGDGHGTRREREGDAARFGQSSEHEGRRGIARARADRRRCRRRARSYGDSPALGGAAPPPDGAESRKKGRDIVFSQAGARQHEDRPRLLTMRDLRWVFAILVALAVSAPIRASAQQPSLADRETARALMDEGDRKRDSGDLAGALKSYEAADALMRVPTTGID